MRAVIPVLLLLACSSGGSNDRPAALAIAPATLPGGTVNAAWSATLFASGGAGGYQWRVVSGALPPGIAGLPASGASVTLGGLPSGAGTFPFTVELRDAQGATVTTGYAVTIIVPGPTPGGSPTSLVGAPSPRAGHAAAWTGSEMVVWGGHDATNAALGTGAA